MTFQKWIQNKKLSLIPKSGSIDDDIFRINYKLVVLDSALQLHEQYEKEAREEPISNYEIENSWELVPGHCPLCESPMITNGKQVECAQRACGYVRNEK